VRPELFDRFHERDHQMAAQCIELGAVLDRHAGDGAEFALFDEHLDGRVGHA
jgi:hypothetical protein